MNFLSMDYFLMVEKERNFTRAAEKLHITQQTLGAHIANVEKELGCKLFIRHVPLELTYAGEVFRSYAEIFQRTYRSMEREFKDITENQTGMLRIGISMIRSRSLMPAIIQKFQEEYPGFEINLMEGTNEMHQQHLYKEEIDLAVANFPQTIPGIELFPFYREEVILLISDGLLHQLYGNRTERVLKELKDGNYSRIQEWPFALTNPEDIAGQVGRHFLQKEQIRPSIRVQSNNIETVLALCLQGTVACFSPENLMEASLTPGQIQTLHRIRLPEEAQYQIRIGVLRKNASWKILQEFIRIAKDSVSAQ